MWLKSGLILWMMRKRLREAIVTTIEKVGYQLKDSSLEKFIQKNDITKNELRILRVVKKFNNTLSCKEIAVKLGLKKNNLSFFIKKLEQKKYVERQVDDQDNRVVLLNLTKSGKNFLKKFNKIENDVLEQFFTGFSESELYQFTAYLKRFSDSFNNQER